MSSILNFLRNRKGAVSLFTALLFVSVFALRVNAAGQSQCQIIYGGGEVCPPEQVKFTINKLVQGPSKGGTFVENLTINDARLTAGQNVTFKIVVENTGNSEITNLNVIDRFPDFLSFVAGVGNANKGAKEVSFVIGSLPQGEKREFLITAQVDQEGKLPSNQAVTCVTNNVRATAPDGSTAEDNAQVCIERGAPQVLEKPPVKEIPATGPELLGLAALIPMGLAGIFLRRKSQ